MDDVLAPLVELARGRRIVALTGAGCSTESGIPDYRGIDSPARRRAPMQHREFMDRPEARRRYWARSALGWPRFAEARPNAGHLALAALEADGIVAGIITQNVDGLHQAAGSREVVELHGALARVRCLACGAVTSRDAVQERLLELNPAFRHDRFAVLAPDGDADLPDDLVAGFAVAVCPCGGTLTPDVVFFGGSVARPTLDAAWSLFDRAELLLVVGSSLAVFSGLRFVRRAAERGLPVAILNHGATRGDEHAAVLVDARCGTALPELARSLRATSAPVPARRAFRR